VPPGRATTSVGAGVSKELLHQRPHTAGTVVAAGESPVKGKYGGGGMAGVVVGAALVRTVEVPWHRCGTWLVRRHLLDWSQRHIDAVENARLLAEFDCKGEVGAFWVKEDPLAADARRVRCFAPYCGKSCVFICSGCKEAPYCSKGCQNRDWGSTFGHDLRTFVSLRGCLSPVILIKIYECVLVRSLQLVASLSLLTRC
jgi:hypothetical protein